MNEQIIEEYKMGTSLFKLYKKYHIAPITIRKILVEQGIKIRSNLEINQHFTPDESFFEIIDTIPKAYFLGFMYADGWVAKDNNRIVIQLNEKDLEILLKFSKCAFGGKQPSKRIWKKKDKIFYGYGLSIRNPKLHDDLIKQGCYNKKSFTLKFPTEKQVPQHLLSHFIRGYFDGDGSIMMKSRYGKEIGGHFTVISSLEFNNIFYNWLKENLGLTMRIELIKKYKYPMSSIQTSKKDNINKLYEFLYKDCGEFYLARKKTKFEECINKIKDKYSRN